MGLKPHGSRLTLALVSVLFVMACDTKTPPRPDWPAAQEGDILDVKLKEGTIQPTQELANAAQVQPDKLVFPRSAASDVIAAWPVGKPVVGTPAENRNKDNPFGFLRKVKAVNMEGENIVVETEPATLQDVVTGTARLNIDVDQGQDINLDEETVARYFPEIGVGEGLPPPDRALPSTREYGQLEQAIHATVNASEVFDQTVSMPVFNVNKDRTYGRGSRAVTVHFQGTGTLTSRFNFRPSLVLGFETGIVSGLEYFKVEANGPMKVESTLDVNVGVTAASGTEPTDLVDLGTLLAEGPETGSLPPVLLARSKPKAGPVILGVPTTFRLSLLADCNFGIQASANAKATVTLEATTARAGLMYTEDDGWEKISEFRFNKGAEASIGFGGGVAVECGLSARVEWLVGDAGGPYLGVRGSVRANGAYADVCDPLAQDNGRPDGKVHAAINAKVQLQVGGKVDAWKVVKFEKGPYNIYEVPFNDLWTFDKTFPRGGLGYCFADCANNLQSNNETDVDCGANCHKCAKGKHCASPSDCISNACGGDGLCVGSTCEDGRKNVDETGIDCGGPLCQPCSDGQECTRNADCGSGVCSRADRPPRVCTSNLCEDGLVSGAEPDVDCGNAWGCTTLCSVGQKCTTDADCTSSACNLTSGRCVETRCIDERRDGDETGPDCGGSCPNKCGLGGGCNARLNGNADCSTGYCGWQSSRCVSGPHVNEYPDYGETDIDCGGTDLSVPRCGRRSHCNEDTDCAGGDACHGRLKVCVQPGCDDGKKNGNETAVDCGGGTCGKCGLSKGCVQNSDCSTDACGGGKCVTDACANGVRDAVEADLDCGSVCGAKSCATGKHCDVPQDCASNICTDNVCSSDACKDRVRNGAETDTDCGGSTCFARCAAGKSCLVGSDCANGICNANTHTCVADQCHDGTRNGDEADVDCGGSCATKCAINKLCNASADCGSNTCNPTRHRCVSDACFDGVRNGSETDVDCGGSCPGKCAFDKGCMAGRDCQSGACQAPSSTCAADQCSDGRQNGDETGLDCGGSCATKCEPGGGCLSGADCANPQGLEGEPGFCTVSTHTCSASSCGDGSKDGDETGLDCGGSCAPAAQCATDDGCNVPSDCQSGFCNATRHKCVASACSDGVKEANETDIDCGNACGPGCGENAACVDGERDCGSGLCDSSTHLCLPRLLTSCLDIYNRNGPGDRTNGVKVLDLDGPRRAYTTPGYGSDAPIATYCDMTNGGWTPYVYLNSNSFMGPDIYDYRTNRSGDVVWDPVRSSWERQNYFSCNADSDCYARSTTSQPSVPAGSVCRQHVCVGTQTFSGLPSAPATYSIPSTSAMPQSYLMNALGRVYNTRWDIYRNGVLLWSTPGNTSTSGPRMLPPSNGYYYAPDPSYSTPWEWLRCAGSYLTTTSVQANNPLYLWNDSNESNDLSQHCHGWATFTGRYATGSQTTNGGTASVMNIFNESEADRSSRRASSLGYADTRVMWGAWVQYGTYSFDVTPNPSFAHMGTCNTAGACMPTDTAYYYSKQVYRKDSGNLVPNPPIGGNVGDGNYGDELNNPLSGTELAAGTTGLVFVYWGK